MPQGGIPPFKRHRHEQGFRADNGPDTVRVDGKEVVLPKIGRVAMVEALRFRGSIREVTVNRTAGRWFACFAVETGEAFPPVKEGPSVGIDVGLQILAVCSDGTVIENPRVLREALARLTRLDKAIARSKNIHGNNQASNRRERLYAKHRKLHARVANLRNDWHHKATTAIAKPAGRMVVEDLNVAGMIQNRRLSRAIADASMGGFLGKLRYKCLCYGTEYVDASRWYPSTKLCSQCGFKQDDLDLSDRRWQCGGCREWNDRDANASVNLERWPGLSFPVSGRGDCVSPATPAVVDEASSEAASSSRSEIRSDWVD